MIDPGNAEASSVRYPTKWEKALVFALPLVGLVLGWLADTYFEPAIKTWLSEQHKSDPAGTPLRFAILLASLLGSVIVLAFTIAAYFWLMSFRTFRFQALPPRGYLITSKTPIIHGSQARREGIKLLLFGVLAVFLMAWVIWSVFDIYPETPLVLEPLFLQLGRNS